MGDKSMATSDHKKVDLVKVKWLDAAAPPTLEQHTYDSAKSIEPCIMIDVGWVINNLPHKIVIAAEREDNEDSFRHTSVIPKVNIIQVEILKSARISRKYFSKYKVRAHDEKNKKVTGKDRKKV
jgi:hypothetical protein